jgi:outer membrane protein assembly factor BamA
LEEAKKYSLTFGAGAQIAKIGGGFTSFDNPAGTAGFSPRFSLGLSRLNFLGLGHTASVKTRISNIQKRGVLSYLAPQFKGNRNLSLQFAGLFDDSRDVRTFAARRLEGSVQLGQRLSKANTMQYRLSYRRVSVDSDTLKISADLIPLLSQPVRIGIASVTFVEDRRDDPSDARSGIYNTADLGFATRGLGSQSDFGRLLLRNATYHRLNRDWVFARSLMFGSMEKVRAGSRDIPLPERFFSGGGASHRGFPDNQAGPRDFTTGFPVGGRALLMNSLELRYPLIGENIGGVFFHDAGNVYSRLGSISLRVRQRDLQDFNYMVHAVGFGIRVRTPIGPFRLDLAYSANSPRFFGFQGTREELLEGRGRQVEQRISRFQFHFSIGQAF